MSDPGHSTSEPPLGWRARIFAISWLSYFSYYFTRKNYSVVKKPLAAATGLDADDLKLIDTLYLAGYSVGQFINGFLGEVIGPRRLVGIGMLLSATLAFVFAAGDALAIFAITYGINGLAQSSGWPGNNRLMASWFSTRRRGEIMGFWTTCYQVGGLAATALATFILVHHGWRWAYVGNALWVVVAAIGFIILVRDHPSEVGFVDPETEVEPDRAARAPWAERLALLKNPMIWALGANYFCMKLTRYSLLFWLPYYFATALDYSEGKAGYMSTSFEAGGIVGVILAGQLADRVFGRRRVMVAAIMTAALAASLGLYGAVGSTSTAINFLTMMLVGACLFGPDSLVSSTIAQDIGGPKAAGFAAGIVNGMGSMGAILQAYVTVEVSKAYGWDALFIVFQFLAVVATLSLLPFVLRRPHIAGDDD